MFPMIKKGARFISRKNRQPGVILMYHRVASLPENYQGLAVTPQHFEEHMAYISQYYFPMRLLEFVKAMKTGKVPERAVVITFDDGYLDNLTNARPILLQHGIPANMFIVTGLIDKQEVFWWDKLEHLIFQAEGTVLICVDSQEYIWQVRDESEKLQALSAAVHVLRELPHFQRESVLQELAHSLQDVDGYDPLSRPMTSSELRELVQSDLIGVGAHTVTHPALSALSKEDQAAEITGSQAALEDIIGIPVDTISFPFGKHDSRTIEIVRESGFQTALGTRSGRVDPGDNIYRLRRCTIEDWDGETFASHMEAFFSEVPKRFHQL